MHEDRHLSSLLSPWNHVTVSGSVLGRRQTLNSPGSGKYHKLYWQERQNHRALHYFYTTLPPLQVQRQENISRGGIPARGRWEDWAVAETCWDTHRDSHSPKHTHIYWTLLWHPCLKICNVACPYASSLFLLILKPPWKTSLIYRLKHCL